MTNYETQEGVIVMKKYVCTVCSYEYDGEVPFNELPDDYTCPVCSVGKDQFEEVE